MSEKKTPRRGPRRVAVLIVIFAAAGSVVFMNRPPVEVPIPDVSQAEVTVAEAITAAHARVLEAPRSESAWRDYAHALDAHSFHEEALVAYDHVLASNPSDRQSLYHRALTLEYLGRPEESLRDYQTLVQGGFDSAAIHFRLGELFNRDGRCAEARDAFRRALDRDPLCDIARRGLGNALLCLDEEAAALEVLEPLAVTAAEDRGAMSALVQAHRRNGNDEKARELSANLPEGSTLALTDPIRHAVTSTAVDAASLLARSKEKEARGEFLAAIADLEDACRADPDDAMLPDRIGRNYLRLNRPREALPHFGHALAIDPSRTTSYYNRGVAHQRSGDRDSAIADYRRALKFDPEYRLALDRLRELGVTP